MSEIRPIDANALKEVIETNFLLQSDQVDIVCKLINNAPTVELKRVKNELNNELNELKPERPQGDLISREVINSEIEKNQPDGLVFRISHGKDYSQLPALLLGASTLPTFKPGYFPKSLASHFKFTIS